MSKARTAPGGERAGGERANERRAQVNAGPGELEGRTGAAAGDDQSWVARAPGEGQRRAGSAAGVGAAGIAGVGVGAGGARAAAPTFPGAGRSQAGGVVVLGLDPGTRHFGWGVVRKLGTRLSHVAHGILEVTNEGSLGDRLVAIERGLVEVVEAHRPDEAAIESLFFAKDAQAAAKLGHARGVGMLVATRAGMSVAEFAPTRVKRTVSGSGRAEKSQVAQMVRVILGLTILPKADAADALAIAITHLQGRATVPPVVRR